MKSDHFWNILKSLCFEVENSKVHFIKSIEKRLTLNSNFRFLHHNNVFVLCSSQLYDVKYLKGKKYNRIVLICRNGTLLKIQNFYFQVNLGLGILVSRSHQCKNYGRMTYQKDQSGRM